MAGCGSSASEGNVPRTLGGTTRLGSFVSSSSYEAFVRAERAVERNELSDAVYQYRVALSGASEDPYVLARLALVLSRLEQHDDANDAVERALRLDPESESAWLAKAQIEESRNNVTAAIAAYERAAAAPISSDTATLQLAALLYRTQDAARADALLQALIEKAGTGALAAARARLQMAVERNDLPGIIENATSIQRIFPMTSGEVRALAARILAGGDGARAADLLATVPESNDDAPLRVNALLAARRYGAVEAFLATHEPARVGSTLDVARIYLAANVPARALELAEGALLTDSGSGGHLVAAEAAFELHLLDRTATHVAAIARGESDYIPSRILLARALASNGMRAEAFEVLTEVAAEAPEDTRVSVALEALRNTQ